MDFPVLGFIPLIALSSIILSLGFILCLIFIRCLNLAKTLRSGSPLKFLIVSFTIGILPLIVGYLLIIISISCRSYGH